MAVGKPPASLVHRESLHCFYSNVQGLMNKLPELLSLQSSHAWDLIAITETWLTDSILDSELSIPGMYLIRKDRLSKGGGVLLYCRCSLTCSIVDDPILSIPDLLCCRIHLRGGHKALVLVLYRPPNCSAEHDNLLIRSLKHALSLGYSHVLLVGDFNAPSLFNSEASPNSFNADFLDIINTHPLYNHIFQPTRFRLPNTPSILDLIFTNEDLMVENVDFLPPLGYSDHVVLSFHFICYAYRIIGDIDHAKTIIQYDQLRHLASAIDWNFLLSSDSVQAHDQFMHCLRSVMDASTITIERRNSNPFRHIRSRTRKWIAFRNEAWFRYRRAPSNSTWEEYRKLRNYCNSLVRGDKRRMQEIVANKCYSNPKYLYKFLNRIRNVKPGIPPLIFADGVTKTAEETAEVFLKYYISVLNTDVDSRPVSHHFQAFENSESPCLTHITFSREKVLHRLRRLKSNSSPGHDQMQPKLFIELADILAEPLSILFQKLFDEGCTPVCWKQGIISPIYKGGNRSLPANYRPVTLLPVLSKVMESIVADELMNHLEQHNFLTPLQHGFRSGRSCMTNLLLAQSDWTKAIDLGIGVDVVYLDFSKAFDRVRHDILLQKLSSCNVGGHCLHWIQSFLHQRMISVRVHGVVSQWEYIPCGVPQGSVLGPRLFLIYINDVVKEIDSKMILFADDIKIWRCINSLDDCKALQNDLDVINQWSAVNYLPLNTDKSHVLSIRHTISFSYQLNGSVLTRNAHERDLGIIIQDNLGWSLNTMKANKTAFKHLGLLRRAFGIFEPNIFSLLFSTYIRPHLEYAAQVCNPWLNRDKQLLEQPLRRATKLVRGLYNVPYPMRLRRLGVYSMSYRLFRGDLILTYRILTDDNHPCRQLFHLSSNCNLRGHQFKLTHQICRVNCRRFFFSLRVCRFWNFLPEEVVTAPSINSFKQRLDNFIGDLCYAMLDVSFP